MRMTALAAGLVVLAASLAGCGGRVEVVPEGSGGAGATSSSGGDAPVVVAPDPPCPSEQPDAMDACTQQGLACTWHTGGCAVTLTCTATTPDINGSVCYPMPLAWAQTQSDCAGGCADGFGPCVPCDDAKEGDACNAVGFHCPGSFGGNCSGIRRCGADHLWHEHFDDFCCL